MQPQRRKHQELRHAMGNRDQLHESIRKGLEGCNWKAFWRYTLGEGREEPIDLNTIISNSRSVKDPPLSRVCPSQMDRL